MLSEKHETKLFAPVKAMLGDGFDLYAEVPVSLPAPFVDESGEKVEMRADLVGVSTDAVIVFEGKMRLDDKLCDQCLRWIPFANRVIAITADVNSVSKPHIERRNILRRHGVGVMYVDQHTAQYTVAFKSEFNGYANTKLITQCLSSYQREAEPGVRGGVKLDRAQDRWQPLREALQDAHDRGVHIMTIAEAVSFSGNCGFNTTKEVKRAIFNAMTGRAKQRKIAGVTSTVVNGLTFLMLEGGAP